jgi:hypothetical protein
MTADQKPHVGANRPAILGVKPPNPTHTTVKRKKPQPKPQPENSSIQASLSLKVNSPDKLIQALKLPTISLAFLGIGKLIHELLPF